jgi:hypothetical protein
MAARPPALPLSVSRKALLVEGSDLAFRRAVDDGTLAAPAGGARGWRGMGVTPQYNIVMHLARPPAGLRLNALAEALGVPVFVVAECRRCRRSA